MSCVVETDGVGGRQSFLLKIKSWNEHVIILLLKLLRFQHLTRLWICPRGDLILILVTFAKIMVLFSVKYFCMLTLIFFFAIQSCSSLVFYVMYSNDYYHTSLLDHLFIFKFGAIETFISNGKLPILQSSPSGSLQIWWFLKLIQLFPITTVLAEIKVVRNYVLNIFEFVTNTLEFTVFTPRVSEVGKIQPIRRKNRFLVYFIGS